MSRMPKVKSRTPITKEEKSIFAPTGDKPNLDISVVKKKVKNINNTEEQVEPAPLAPVEQPKKKRTYKKSNNYLTDKKKKQLAEARKKSLAARKQRKEDARLYRESQTNPPSRAPVKDTQRRQTHKGRSPSCYANSYELESSDSDSDIDVNYGRRGEKQTYNVDYNQLTDMVYSRFRNELQEEQRIKKQKEDKEREIREYEESIRADERKKIEEKFSTYKRGQVRRRPQPVRPQGKFKSTYGLGVKGGGGAFGNFW